MMNQSFARQQRLLRLSSWGFGLLAALLSMGLFAVYLNQAVSFPLGFHLQLPASLAVALSSIFWWWWLVVTPKQLSVLQGIAVGAVSIFFAIPLMWLFLFTFNALSGHAPVPATLFGILQAVGTFWLFSDLFLILSLPGLSILATGLITGGLYMLLVRRLVGPLIPKQPEGAGSQEEPDPTGSTIVLPERPWWRLF